MLEWNRSGEEIRRETVKSLRGLRQQISQDIVLLGCSGIFAKTWILELEHCRNYELSAMSYEILSK